MVLKIFINVCLKYVLKRVLQGWVPLLLFTIILYYSTIQLQSPFFNQHCTTWCRTGQCRCSQWATDYCLWFLLFETIPHFPTFITYLAISDILHTLRTAAIKTFSTRWHSAGHFYKEHSWINYNYVYYFLNYVPSQKEGHQPIVFISAEQICYII